METRWHAPSRKMLDSVDPDMRPLLAGKVVRLNMSLLQDFDMQWLFPSLR